MDNNNQNLEKLNLEKTDWKSSREFFESLSDELEKLDDHSEKYDFTWVGKRKSIIEAGSPINKTLRPDLKNSKDWENTQNLFIEGDNLDSLKLLQESYLGKVKMIYIDPPYNTGKDFVYHDNFKASVKDYQEQTDYKDEDGNIQYTQNSKENGRYHSDWLSMMYPRLKLARNLLSNDGVIFISIDDNEQSNLKKMCDEVFGEGNFVADFIWKKTENIKMDSKFVSVNKDHILCYRKSIELKKFNKSLSNIDRYNLNDEKGRYYLRKLDSKSHTYSKKLDYVIDYNGIKYYAGGSKEKRNKRINGEHGLYAPRWLWSEENFKKGLKNNEIVFKNNNVYNKVRYDGVAKKPYTDFIDADSGQRAQTDNNKLMGDNRYFDHPKPVNLVTFLYKLVGCINSNDIILDFFAGSATTAHAVMQLNAEDGGNRKFIMVQLPEETDEKSEAYKAGYKTIAEISRERIRRAGEKIKEDFKDKLSERDTPLDVGFRALKVDETNYKNTYLPAGEYQQSMLEGMVDNIKEDRTDLDLLYGVLLKTGLEYNRPIETISINNKTVYKYDYFGEYSGLVACFEDNLDEDTIKQIANLKPLTAIFKESSFEYSKDKLNLTEHFKIISKDTKVKVV